MKDKIFFDANVLLALLLKRHGCGAVTDVLHNLTDEIVCISALSGHLVVHFRPKGLDLSVIEKFLLDYTMIDLSLDDFKLAFDTVPDGDFEDALQIASALRYGCNIFYTFDKQLAKSYGNLPTLEIKLLD